MPQTRVGRTTTVEELDARLYDQRGIGWPGELLTDEANGAGYRAQWAWTFDRAAEATTIAFGWDELGPGGRVVASFELPPRVLRVVGRLEIEHALRRAGFEIEALYGAFDRSPYEHGSESQIWVARRPAGD